MKNIKSKVLLLMIYASIINSCGNESDPDPMIQSAVVETVAITNVTQTNAKGGGNVVDDGGGSVESRGIVWSTSSNPSVQTNSGMTSDGIGKGTFVSEIIDLLSDRMYYVRAYASNEAGTVYGSELSFQTTKTISLPTVTTNEVVNIKSTSAQSGGAVTNDGNDNISAYGVCWGTSPSPTVANNKTVEVASMSGFSSELTSLQSNTTYYVRAYATNSLGTAYGNEISFKTLGLPTVVTNLITEITENSASGGGTISSDGGSSIIDKGICWSTSQNPTIDNFKVSVGLGNEEFSVSLTNLSANTIYYVKAYATNSEGTSYGEEVTFQTLIESTVTDIDGNVYSTVKIGDQVWMSENLKTTRYADGSPISDGTLLGNIGYTAKYYFIYENDPNYKNTYGLLYTWAAATNGVNGTANPSGVQGACPVGWHVPSNAEKTELITYLGGSDVAGGKMKEVSLVHWSSPNTGATNESGFTGLGTGGFYYQPGYRYNYMLIGQGGWIWTATTNPNHVDQTTAYAINLGYKSEKSPIDNADNKGNGESVRCVKD